MYGLGVVLVVILFIWLAVKLVRSSKFDKFYNDLFKGKLDESSVGDTMKDITVAEKDLGKQVEVNVKEADRLADESKGIDDFLNKGGRVEKKREDC